jgi:PleD family two-component response regulator
MTQEKPQTKLEPDHASNCRGSGETVPVVDDEPMQRRVASEILAILGYRPVSVASGEEAIDHVQPP